MNQSPIVNVNKMRGYEQIKSFNIITKTGTGSRQGDGVSDEDKQKRKKKLVTHELTLE